jgi:hypothetical protein
MFAHPTLHTASAAPIIFGLEESAGEQLPSRATTESMRRVRGREARDEVRM